MLEFFKHFFEGYTAQQVILSAIGALIAFFPSVNILQWIKEKTGWADNVMHYAVVGFFMVLALIIMLLTGEISPAGIDWTLETLLAYWGSFAVIGEAAYQRLKAREAKEAEEVIE